MAAPNRDTYIRTGPGEMRKGFPWGSGIEQETWARVREWEVGGELWAGSGGPSDGVFLPQLSNRSFLEPDLHPTRHPVGTDTVNWTGFKIFISSYAFHATLRTSHISVFYPSFQTLYLTPLVSSALILVPPLQHLSHPFSFCHSHEKGSVLSPSSFTESSSPFFVQ